MRIGIAGAGIMGQLVAFSLIRSGFDVTLFDNKKTNCSNTAAGMLAPILETEKNSPLIFELGQKGLSRHWPDILFALNHSCGFRARGSLVVCHPQDQHELKRLITAIQSRVPKHDYQFLNQAELLEMEPELTKFTYAYHFPCEANINNQVLMMVLKKYLIEHHVHCVSSHVIDILPSKIKTKEKTYSFDWVIDCRGLGAKKWFNDLRGIRGEIIWLYAPQVNISRPIRLLHPRYALYLVPRDKHRYLLGASEIEAEDTSAISVRTTLELLTAAYYLNSKLSEARIIRTLTHCRPTLANHLPKIKYCNGLIAINGLYRHGFLIAPTLAFEVERFLTLDLKHFSMLWEQI